MTKMFAQYFQKAFEKAGYHAHVKEDKLWFAPLEMEMSFEHVYTEGYAVCIKVSITHPSLLPEGLHELAFGFGETDEARMTYASDGWMGVDFPVIHSYLRPTHDDLGVKRLEMVSQTGDQMLGWNALLGPFAIMGDSMDINEDNAHEMFIELFNEITGELSSPQIVYLKCFVSKSNDGSIDVDCRLQGLDWLEGKNKLYDFAKQLDTKGQFHSRKQFMMIYPRPLTELQKGESLAGDVRKKHKELYDQRPEQTDKKWYEFWK